VLWVSADETCSSRYFSGWRSQFVVIGDADDHLHVPVILLVTKTFNLPAKPFQP
jgi:hypothetical protein